MTTLQSVWLEAQNDLPDGDVLLRSFRKSATSAPVDMTDSGVGGQAISREQLAQMIAQLKPGGRIELSEFALVLDANDRVHIEGTKAIGLDEFHNGYLDRQQQQMSKSASTGPSFGDSLLGLWALSGSEDI